MRYVDVSHTLARNGEAIAGLLGEGRKRLKYAFNNGLAHSSLLSRRKVQLREVKAAVPIGNALFAPSAVQRGNLKRSERGFIFSTVGVVFRSNS